MRRAHLADRRSRLAVIAFLGLTGSLLAGTGPAGATDAGPALPCLPVLGATTGGEAAVDDLGHGLAAAAVANGMDSGTLSRILTNDPTAHLDRCARLFYVEPPMSAAERAAVAAAGPSGITAPSGTDVFALSSRSASKRVIYLDFTGFTVKDTAWNQLYSSEFGSSRALKGFDLDGNASTFSAAERNAIYEIWLRVSEDYAPFDVNVTTKDPSQAKITRSSSSDLYYGTRAVITNDPVFASACGCGGQAYVGVFNESSWHAFYQPALIVGGNGGGDAQSIAEATTHEVGHNLGLSHDGISGGEEYYAGHGPWAPIMGVGYYHPVTQWSKGEYSGASNTEDDLAVIAAHGAARVGDDHADSASSATLLTVGTGKSGIISSRYDNDWFTFTTSSGVVTVTLTPRTVGPNLDARIDLYRSNGTTLGMSNPTVQELNYSSVSGMSAKIVKTLSSGTYRVRVKGTGYGTVNSGYSTYGSLGRYTVKVTKA